MYSSNGGREPSTASPRMMSEAQRRSVIAAMSRRSRPLRPGVAPARRATCSSPRWRAYRRRMAARQFSSGIPNVTTMSKRDSRAASRSPLRLVAPMTTERRASKPSISRRRTLNIRRLASCTSPRSRLPPSESSSSKNTIAPPSASAALNTLDSRPSLSPYHLLSTASSGTYTSGTAAWLLMTRALVVFPVPGGPSNRTARGRLLANFSRVASARRWYTSGRSSGYSKQSSICRFWSS
mmetsp:Transcript_37838/g.112035  ORF Transcript_37838/g.112035 Transcript_37838/m.112035 type:complete len:238 (+) Transcript_37838:216-929(+)